MDILTVPQPVSRTEMTKYFPNEKLSTTLVKDKMIKVYGLLSTNINAKKYHLEGDMNIEMPLGSLKSIDRSC